MGSRVGIAVAGFGALLVVAGCGSTRSTASQCPKPVAYDEATLKKISEALRALPDPVAQPRFTPVELASTGGDPAPDTPPGI
jgi:hypothetical protein